MLEKFWDDVVAGPHPDRGLGRLRRIATGITGNNVLQNMHVYTHIQKYPCHLIIWGLDAEGGRKYQRSLSMPTSPETPSSPASPRAADNVWRSVFNPGSNLATKTIGSNVFDKPQPNSPSVYDWLYSEGTKSEHR
ncbi:dormancy-associated protein 1-like isoform X1 [Cucumis melo]|uniref:Dormancy-associated protein 1-like isoform X1 n=1 Tax=Cucumis melo TaxID=3656 RepID=A0ABM3KDH1_CUCME|nr:dormancy-associated protein 1-like isoform X1 [Cucumis melo]